MVILLCRIPSYRNASGLCSDFFLKSIGVTANHRHAVYSCILLFFHQTSNLHSHRVTHLKTLHRNSSVTMFSHNTAGFHVFLSFLERHNTLLFAKRSAAATQAIDSNFTVIRSNDANLQPNHNRRTSTRSLVAFLIVVTLC